MTPYVMRAAFRTNAPDKHLEFYRTVQDILHNKSIRWYIWYTRRYQTYQRKGKGEGEYTIFS